MAPNLAIDAESTADLTDYARVSIAFDVRVVFDVGEPAADRASLVLTERRLERPYVKDYDAVDGDHPTHWARRFDLSKWIAFAARRGATRVGSAAVAFDTGEVELLEGRRDLAILWDLRVAPSARGQGVGTALFRAVEDWALARGCRELKIETQNVNVPACRFYASRGCELRAANRLFYPDLPEEIQLLWYKELPCGAQVP